MLQNKLIQRLEVLRQQSLYRKRSARDSESNLLNFSNNDYLSLANDDRIKRAYQKGFKDYPAGSGGSMLICGYHAMHRTLEKEFAQALQVDDCLLFSSGFAANYSVIAMLAEYGAEFLIDKSVHASVYDGLHSARATYSRYKHNDLTDLNRRLDTLSNDVVVMTESIFSMSGQIAPLNLLSSLCKTKNYPLLVDEAHGFGVLGPEGLGGVVANQLTQYEVPLRAISFGKAFSSSGAIVAGQQIYIDALIQAARPYIYSTAISPALAYAVLETLIFIRQADDRRRKLNALIVYFQNRIKQSNLTWRDSNSAIQQLQLKCPHLALSYAKKLQEHSIICMAIRQPTVSKQETGLRVVLNYNHQPEDIDRLFTVLEQVDQER